MADLKQQLAQTSKFIQLGKLEAAEKRLRRLLAEFPNQPQVLAGLANIAILRKELHAAVERLEQLLAVKPYDHQVHRQLSMVHNNLGAQYEHDERFEQALYHFQRALRVQPNNHLALYNLGLLYRQRGALSDAKAILQRAVQLQPENLDYLIALARLQEQLHQHADAVVTTKRYLASRSQDLQIKNQLARQLKNGDHVEEARTVYDEIYHQDPHQVRALIASKLALPAVYRNHAHIVQSRIDYAKGLDELWDLVDQKAIPVEGVNLDAFRWCNFFLAYQGRNDCPLQEKYGCFLSQALADLVDPPPPRPVRRRPRILIISSFLRDCTVGHYFHSWVDALVKTGFETLLIQLGPYEDNFTQEIGSQATRLLRFKGKPSTIVTPIRELQADLILYPELGMDEDTFLLGSLRLAPIQICAWGHPSTTGLPSIDYYLTCQSMEPEDAPSHYSEKLIGLPGLGTAYRPTALEENRDRPALGLPEHRRLYLLPHSPFKVHPDNDALMTDLLSRDPDGCLIMFEGPNPVHTEGLLSRIKGVLTDHGISADHRLVILPAMSRQRYLQANHCCDVMLDTLHWSGGNSSLDALSVGLPIVTVPGKLMRGRQTAAMLQMLGLEELVCNAPVQMAEKAIEIAHDSAMRQHLSRSIVDRQPALFDRPEGPEQLTKIIGDLLARDIPK